MANNLTPIVYDAASKDHKPAAVGEHISPAFIAVDAAPANLLQNKPDEGLSVQASNFVSPLAGNTLTVGPDGKLFAGGSTQDFLSKEPGNYLRYGNDKGVFADGNDVLSNGQTNLLRINAVDGKVELTKDVLEAAGIGGTDPTLVQDVAQLKTDMTTAKSDITALKKDVEDVTIVSADRNNVLVEGRDGGAYLDSDAIVDVVEEAGITGKVDVSKLINVGTDPLLTQQGDKLVSEIKLDYLEANGVLTIYGPNNRPVATTTIPTAVALLERVQLETNPVGQPAGTYIHFTFKLTDQTRSEIYLNVNELAQFYSAGAGIYIDPNGVISVDPVTLVNSINTAIQSGRVNIVSTTAGNLLKKGTDGGAVLDNDAVAASVNNALFTGAVSVVSGNAGNLISKGTDNGAFLNEEKIIETVGDNIKDIATEAIKQAIKDGEVNIISQDADNQLTTGADGGAYLKKDAITDTVNEAIGDGTIPIVSSDEDNVLSQGADGGAYLDPKDVPAAGPSTDPGNALVEGSDGKLYFKPVTDYGLLD